MMCTKSNPVNRIVAVKTIDRLFYEPRNMKRSHKQAHKLFGHPLFGICKASNRNYRCAPDELLKRYPMPGHLESMFRLAVLLVKNMPPAEAAKVLNRFCEMAERSVRRVRAAHAPMNAETILAHLADTKE